MARKRLNTLPSIPKDASAATKRWMQTVAEALEVRLGRRGDPGEAAVTFNDLIESGVVEVGRGTRGNGSGGPPVIQPPDNGSGDGLTPPPKPKNLYVVASFKTIMIHWDEPPNRGDVTYTEIARSEDNDFANATIIGGTGGNQYLDIITEPEGKTFYYWARHVTYKGVTGPWSDAQSGTKLADMGLLLEALNSGLSSEPDDMGAADETLILHANRFAVRVGEGETVQHPFIIIYGKINADGIIEEVAASDPDGQPYIVMDTAFIRKASIQSGQLGSVSSGILTLPDGTPITNVNGQLTATGIDTNNLHVSESTTFTGSVKSTYYSSGNYGWYLQQNGDFEMNSGWIRSAVQIGGETASALRSRVTGAQNTADGAQADANSAQSTANSAQSTANAANNRVNDWTRPGSTLIWGNKIYTGDAYVDTLQIKGQAITVPAVAYPGNVNNVGNNVWVQLAAAGINVLGGSVTIVASLYAQASASDHPTNGYARANCGVSVRMRGYDNRGLLFQDILFAEGDSDFDDGGSNNEGGDATAQVNTYVSISTMQPNTSGNFTVYLDFRANGDPNFWGGASNIKLTLIGGKR